MSESKAQRLAAALDQFINSSPDVEAAAVVSFDGLPMASALPDTMEEDRVGAMSAALLSLGEQAALGLGRGQLNQVFVEGEHGFVFLMSARDQAVLSAVAGRSAKIGFMLFEMRRAAERIGDVLVETNDYADAYAAFADTQAERPSEPQPEPVAAENHHEPQPEAAPVEHHYDPRPEPAPVEHHDPQPDPVHVDQRPEPIFEHETFEAPEPDRAGAPWQ